MAAGDEKGEWPYWKLILIALPQLSVQVLWCFIGPHSAPYMRHLGASNSLATLNNIAGPITGFFTGPIVGAYSDTLRSKLGRRRPVILVGLGSLWVAGMLFSASEHLFAKDVAIYFAAPMYWVMDVTINILQTPHRALVSDLASERQQIPMQVVFVVFMSVGNFLAFSIMQIYAVPVDHMLELMFGICCLNTFIVFIQFSVAKETPWKPPAGFTSNTSGPINDVKMAVQNSPQLLFHLAFIQCLVWIGNTAWNLYAEQWFGNAVFEGDETAPAGSAAKMRFAEGVTAFAHGGQLKSVLQLIAALTIIAVLLRTSIRPRYVYAPCIFIGVLACGLAAFVVGHNATLAMFCLMISVMPETGSFAIPFGLVATLNKRAAQEGKLVSTALQMALLNCCVTVGQQICTMTLAGIEGKLSLDKALPLIFIIAGASQAVAGGCTLTLNDDMGDTRAYEGAGSTENSEDSDQ